MSEAQPLARAEERAWPRIAPFAVFIVLLTIEPYLADLAEPALDPRWLYAIRSAITAAVLLGLWRQYPELRRDRDQRPGIRDWTFAVVAGAIVFGLWITLDSPPFVLTIATSPFDPSVGGRVHWGFALTRLAGAVLVVPIVEELFWRSFLMRWLEDHRFLRVDPARVGWKALIITSAVFAVEHRLWVAGLAAGLIYGELYRRTGSVWVVTLSHALTNALLGTYVLATGSWGFW